jgi:acyl-CoA thioesterase FadM
VARIKLDLPETFIFTTEMDVQICHINYGGHLGNDSLLALIHEARIRFLESMGYSEMNIEGAGLIMSDAAVVYAAEVFRGDRLTIEIAAHDFSRVGCDLFYRLTSRRLGKEVARAKTGILFFDYEARKVRPIPENFRKRISELER